MSGARMAWIPRVFATVGLGLTIVAALGAVALRLVDPAPVVPSTFGFGDWSLVGFAFLGLNFSAVGALLVVRRPTNAIGWAMVVIGLSHALAALMAAVVFSAVADGPRAAGLAETAAWVAVVASTVGGLFFVLGAMFPTGRGATPGWDRVLLAILIVGPIVITVGIFLRPGPLQVFPTIDNPFGIGPDLRPIFGPEPAQAVASFTALLAPLVLWAMVARYRVSGSVERQQLKWFVLSLAVTVGAIAVAAVSASLMERPPEVSLALYGFAGAAVPVAIGIAILRYRLYEIDRIISRTIGWAAVTGVLVAVFAGGVLALQALLSDVTQGQTLAVAASTLLAFALFQPVRRRVQRAVDRRFDRGRYDAERTAAEFAQRLRGDIGLESLVAELDATVEAAVRPSAVGVWLPARSGR